MSIKSSKSAGNNVPDIGKLNISDPKEDSEVIDKRDEAKIEIMSNRYKSPEADITMISSDGITFKVHSYRLQGIS
jgi:hypothetical protein